MQIKICPKCGAKNRPDKVACSGCYASLENTIPTESNEPTPSVAVSKPKVSAQPPVAAKTSAAPPDQAANTSQAPPNPYGPPPGTQAPRNIPYTPPPSMSYNSAPVRTGSNPIVIILIVIAILGAIGGSIMMQIKNKPKPPTAAPEITVSAFLEAKKTGKAINVKPFLSESSIKLLENAFSSKQYQSAGFTRKDAEDMYLFNVPPTSHDLDYAKIDKMERVQEKDEDPMIAVMKVNWTTQVKLLGPMPDSAELVLVAEESKWKVDLKKSMKRANTERGINLLGGPPMQGMPKTGM